MEFGRIFEKWVRKSLNSLQQSVHGILDIKATVGDKACATGNCRKVNLSDGMPDPLATLSPAREYEVDNVSGYLSDLAMEISNKSVEYDNT